MNSGDHIQVMWHGVLLDAVFIRYDEHGVLLWRYPHELVEDLDI